MYNLFLPGLMFFITVYCAQLQYNTKLVVHFLGSASQEKKRYLSGVVLKVAVIVSLEFTVRPVPYIILLV